MHKLKQNLLPVSLLTASLMLMSHVGWLHVKANLGQLLLENAWQHTLQTQQVHKAWSWADTWPVAKLTVPSSGQSPSQSLIVLEGTSGEAMAFGPGRVSGLSRTARQGVFAIGGHRDSHLQFLEHIEIGTKLHLQTPDGAEQLFEVSESFVADSASDDLLIAKNQHALVLITCYPFNALQTGGSKRYVVIATPDISMT